MKNNKDEKDLQKILARATTTAILTSIGMLIFWTIVFTILSVFE